MPKSLRDVVVSISLANLCFLSAWLILLNPNHYAYYYWKHDPGYTESLSLITLVLLLATVFWTLSRFVKKRVAGVGFLLVLTWPINSFLIDYLNVSPLTHALRSSWRLLVLLALMLVPFVLCWRYEKRIVAVAVTILTLLSPLVIVNVTAAVLLRHKYPFVAPLQRTNQATDLLSVQGPKVVWIIFDELQTQSVFENRLPGLSLQEFDRLASESLSATNAYPPSGQTATSVPGLITGHLIRSAVPIARNELQLTTEEGAVETWSKDSSIFSEAKQAGFSTSVAGWFHPYCRVIGRQLDSCYWTPQIGQTNPVLDRLTFGRGLLSNLTTAVLRIPFSFRLFHEVYETKQRNDHERALSEIEDNAVRILAHQPNLTLIHFSVPHSPWISANSIDRGSVEGYMANVVFADQALGKVRQAMATNWDSSIVLVSSDHWWRDAPLRSGRRDHRIPFFLKLAGQKEKVDYKDSFNTILTRELLLQLLRGEMRKPSEVVEWIERKSRLGESSLTVNAP